jgi:hypothetical protein
MSEHMLGHPVLLCAVLDVTTSKHAKDTEFQSVQSWAGAFLSRDFRLICALAGLDPDATHEASNR